jgi:adenosylmethionine-8-amino-7-oxononanoate aminotransferase
MNLAQLDRTYLLRGSSDAEDLQIVKTDGFYVIDARGKRYIDFVVGWCVGNLGWGKPPIRSATRRFAGPDYVHPHFLYRPWAELAKLLAEITPGKLNRCVRATGGTEAVEIALQIAMLHKKRKKFLSIEGSYHGNSIATMSIASSENRELYPNLLPDCLKLKPPLDRKAADKAETLLKRRDIAAFIMEPVICNLGAIVPDKAFMQRMAELCRRYGTLLIMDEVATGFGRTGKMFATDHFDIEPDILCLAKAVTGGYAGLGATIVTDAVAKSVEGDFSIWSTYGWHPLSVDAAIASIRYLRKSEIRLMKNVADLSEYFRTRLTQMEWKQRPTIHVKGFAIGLEFEDEDYPSKVQEKCRKRGLLVSADDDVLMILPPLEVDRKTTERAMDILEQAL